MSPGNRKAFLDMLAWSELGPLIDDPERGYDIIVGGEHFTSYADHPRKHVWLPKYEIWSTAAGRYQILERNYDFYKDLLVLPDFSPNSQDEIALQMITEAGALTAIDTGDIPTAVTRCAHIWASLPGNTYRQHTNPIEKLSFIYTDNGGVLA